MRLERHTGRPHDHDDRVLLEAPLIDGSDLVEPRDVVDLTGQHDLHDLAGLANDSVARLIPPLPGGIHHGETLGEAGKNLVVEKTTPFGFVHAEAAADVAA